MKKLALCLLLAACGDPSGLHELSLGWKFTADAGTRATSGISPMPLVVNGKTYLFLNNGTNTVLQSTDGLSFASVPASYPSGTSYSFVTLSDGRIRMYYYDAATGLVRSAISTDGLNYTAESGIRTTLNLQAGPKVVATGNGYRMYYAAGANQPILSQFSTDGLSFTAEPDVRLPKQIGYDWGDPVVINNGGEWLMLVTDLPTIGALSTAYSTIWIATSQDGLNWTRDNKPLISNETGSVVDAAFLKTSTGLRVYYGLNVGRTGYDSATPSQILSGTISK